jgi:hypothetical protein
MLWDSADNIEELTTSVTGFIRKCIGDLSPQIRCFPNQKPWINTKVGTKLKDRATAHRAIADNPEATAEDRIKVKRSHNDLSRVIKRAREQYRNRVESYYTDSDDCHMWQGL